MLARSTPFCLAIVVLLSACGGGGFVGEIVHPAELPVRSRAPIVVVHAGDADSAAVAAGLLAALVRGGTHAALADGRESSGAAAVLRIEVTARFRPRSEIRWTTRPENVCGPYGCYVRQVSYPYDVLLLVGEASIRIVDVASGTVLAQRPAARELPGSDGEMRRAQLRNELVAQIARWIDPRVERVRVDFRRVRLEGVSRARAHARDARWDEAARELEALVADAAYASASPAVRADVLHDLALSIRFGSAVRTEPVRNLERALGFAEDAVRLDSRNAHVALRDALRAQLEEARVLEQQSRPAPAPAGPIPVPPGYGR